MCCLFAAVHISLAVVTANRLPFPLRLAQGAPWPWGSCRVFMALSLESTDELDDFPCSCRDSSYVLVLILSIRHLWKSYFLVNSLYDKLQHSSLSGTLGTSLFKMSPLVLFCEQDLWHLSTCVMHTVQIIVWVDVCVFSVIHLCTVPFKHHLEAS